MVDVKNMIMHHASILMQQRNNKYCNQKCLNIFFQNRQKNDAFFLADLAFLFPAVIPFKIS
jgi:hypothetical protein